MFLAPRVQLDQNFSPTLYIYWEMISNLFCTKFAENLSEMFRTCFYMSGHSFFVLVALFEITGRLDLFPSFFAFSEMIDRFLCRRNSRKFTIFRQVKTLPDSTYIDFAIYYFSLKSLVQLLQILIKLPWRKIYSLRYIKVRNILHFHYSLNVENSFQHILINVNWGLMWFCDIMYIIGLMFGKFMELQSHRFFTLWIRL